MSTVKISELPAITHLNSNTANTLIVGVDIPTGVTGKISATVIAESLYSNNALNVGNNDIVFPGVVGQFVSNNENYLQVNLQNLNGNGSSDYVATADVGTDSVYYIDLGFSGSDYDNLSPNNSLGTSLYPLDEYVYVQGNTGHPGGNLVIGTTVTGTQIKFIVGGVDSQNVVATVNTTGLYSATISNSSTYANGAFRQANSSYNSQNTTGTYANSAYTQANSSFSKANASFGVANTALQNTTVVVVNGLNATNSVIGNTSINNGVSISGGGLFQYTSANNSTVTQATSKSTGVTCNGRTGQITTNNAALAGGRSVTFTVTNNQIVSNKDVVIVNIASGATIDTYQVGATAVTPGSFNITVSNVSSTSQSDALVINFAIIRVQ
jgi:hypothetical protein